MSRASLRLVRRILSNGLRLYFRGWQGKRRNLAVTLLVQALLLVFLHVQMPIIFTQVARTGSAAGGAALACAFVILFTLTAGFHRSLEVLFNRGDLPLLLSSPVPPRIVVVTRLADVLLSTALATMFLVLPMLNAAVYLYGTHWLWGWAAWACGVVAVGAIALMLTLVLVSWIGTRGTRTLLQVLGVVVGTCAILMMQAPNWMRHFGQRGDRAATLRRYFDTFDVPPLTHLASAAAGDLPALLALGGISAVCVWLAVRVLERTFVSGAQRAAAEPGARPSRAPAAVAIQRAWSRAFRSGRWATLVRKELRLLRRDPLLLARSSTQLISFAPALASLFIMPRAAAVGMLAVIAATMTALTTATLMTASDESLELACTSPISRGAAMWARTLAASLPGTLVGWVGAGAMALLGTLTLSLATGAIATFLALAHAWLGSCTTPRQSSEERAANRPVRTTWQSFVAMLVGGFGAGTVASQGMGAPVFVAIPLAALTVLSGGLMFLVRPKPVWAA